MSPSYLIIELLELECISEITWSNFLLSQLIPPSLWTLVAKDPTHPSSSLFRAEIRYFGFKDQTIFKKYNLEQVP